MITDILGVKKIGDIVGTLGFADVPHVCRRDIDKQELLSIFMVAVWGTLSDKISTRPVATIGYLLVGASLFAFVHPSKVYPDLIILRLFFALGGSACVAMVTAILPQLTPSASNPSTDSGKPVNGKIAGLAGFCTGVGALIAVTVFLPLPRLFIRYGYKMKEAVQNAFYIVGSFAFLISLFMFIGLKRDSSKGFKTLFKRGDQGSGKTYFKLMGEGFLAAKDPRIALAYIGGFVARADSIVVSLFIPTIVSHYFVEKGLCTVDPHAPAEEIKEGCRQAYSLAAALTGSSQLVALLSAPIVGWSCDRFDRRWILVVTGLIGILGFGGLGAVSDYPRGAAAFIFAMLSGLGQISAIVTSLGLSTGPYVDPSIRGSVAGAYSLTGKFIMSKSILMVGGCGILVLTKLGGYLFDKWTPAAPFYIMAIFNGVALLAGVVVILIDRRTSKIRLPDGEQEPLVSDEPDETS